MKNNQYEKLLNKFNKIVDEMTAIFVKKYFPDCDKRDYWWVGDMRTGTLYVSDYFWNLERVYEALELNATEKQLFEFYDKELDNSMKEIPMPLNFKSFIKFNGWKVPK